MIHAVETSSRLAVNASNILRLLDSDHCLDSITPLKHWPFLMTA